MTNFQAEETFSLEQLERLGTQATKAKQMIDELPVNSAIRTELKQSWGITLQKLSYFRREMKKADDELRINLGVLHQTLLPGIIKYQVAVGAMMIQDHCDDHRHLHRWKAIWQNYDID